MKGPAIFSIEVTRYGGPEVLQPLDHPTPEPTEARPVLVRMQATAVNPVDLAIRAGHLTQRTPNLPLPFKLGWEIVGAVVASAAGYQAGQRVAGMLPWFQLGNGEGTYAEIVPAAAEWLVPLPDAVTPDVAASASLNGLAARQGLDNLATYGPGTSILITGASGTVGAFATQFAVDDGLTVLAMPSADDEGFATALGAKHIVRRGSIEDVISQVRRIVPGGVDAVFDAALIAGPLLPAIRDGGSFGVASEAVMPEAERDIQLSTVRTVPNQRQLQDLGA